MILAFHLLSFGAGMAAGAALVVLLAVILLVYGFGGLGPPMW